MSGIGNSLRLDHLYLPAQKPEWLAEWYAETFGFKAQAGFVISGGVVLVFQKGDPIPNSQGLPQFGFRAVSRDYVEQLAETLNVAVSTEALFCSFQANDPEGYRFEVYWEGNVIA